MPASSAVPATAADLARMASEPSTGQAHRTGIADKLRHQAAQESGPNLAARLRSGDVLYILCTGHLADAHVPFILPAPIVVPPLASRAHELDRIIAEYAADA